MKMKTLLYWMEILLIVLFFCGVAGCVSSKGEVIVNSLPPDLHLEREGVLRLRVYSTIEDSAECCKDIHDKLAAMLKEREVFREVVLAEDNSKTKPGMRLEVKVVKLHKVGTASRIFLGTSQGQARVVTENRLFFQADGKEIGSFITEGESSLKGIVSELSGTTKQAIKRVVEQVVDVLQQYLK